MERYTKISNVVTEKQGESRCVVDMHDYQIKRGQLVAILFFDVKYSELK